MHVAASWGGQTGCTTALGDCLQDVHSSCMTLEVLEVFSSVLPRRALCSLVVYMYDLCHGHG